MSGRKPKPEQLQICAVVSVETEQYRYAGVLAY